MPRSAFPGGAGGEAIEALLVLQVLAIALVVVPLIGGLLLWVSAKLFRSQRTGLLHCWLAYAVGYIPACGAAVVLALQLGDRFGIPPRVLPVIYGVWFLVQLPLVPLVMGWRGPKTLAAALPALVLWSAALVGCATPVLLGQRRGVKQAMSLCALRNVHGAMMTYTMANDGRFPGPICAKDGTPLLSWRVNILPHIGMGYDDLYERLKLDEPWDSPHNKALLGEIPRELAPIDAPDLPPGSTRIKVFVHDWGDAKPGGLPSRRDRPLTLFGAPAPGAPLWEPRMHYIVSPEDKFLVVDAGEPVPWTKPADIPYAPDKPLPNLDSPLGAGFSAAFVDGHVTFIDRDTPEATLRGQIEARRRD